MPESAKKHPKNVPGRYYVDCEACASHFLCVDLAPGNFRSDEGGEHRWQPYVFKQPETPDEERRCREAVDSCPMGAIYDDGEEHV
jgi:ferredoxin